MKLINYKMGYDTTFDCTIHGTIEMDREEFRKALPLMRRASVRDFERDITKGYWVDRRGNHHYCFGVAVTDALAKKYALRGYRRGNYQIRLMAN